MSHVLAVIICMSVPSPKTVGATPEVAHLTQCRQYIEICFASSRMIVFVVSADYEPKYSDHLISRGFCASVSFICKIDAAPVHYMVGSL